TATLGRMNEKRFDLTDRLEDFAASIILVYDQKPMSYAGDYLAKQLIRSSCSSALNYGEVLGAGTEKDKINKLRIVLKELRESLRNLNIQTKAKLMPIDSLNVFKDENDQLIRIIVTRIKNIN
ncbi:MAG: four helix bundle protein, partial [Mesonia sp.]|uniref:four helix bundle protein n=1 Tax=Mesonia sp. TaxID=1960830 RepID=UPI003F980F84